MEEDVLLEGLIRNWASLIKRVREEARITLKDPTSDGITIITMHMAVDAKGNPLGWVVRPGTKLEPAKNASKLLRALTDYGDI